MRYAAVLFVLTISQLVDAQYDIGISGGVFTQKFKSNKFHVRSIPWSVSLFYRERVARHTDLGLDLNLVNARFSGGWSDGGLGAGSSVSASKVDLQYLQISPYLDVRMEPKGNVVIRFGPQLGLKLSERITGSTTNWSLIQGMSQREYARSKTDHFRDTDLRLLIGLGFRSGDDGADALTFDPYISYGLFTMLHTKYERESSIMIGLRIGIALRFERKPFTRWIQGNTPSSQSKSGSDQRSDQFSRNSKLTELMQ